MHIRKLSLALVAIFLMSTAASYAANDLERYVVKGVQKYKLDTNGNETLAGNLSVAGTLTTTGVFTPYSRTIAQLNALAPSAAGQVVFCSDCVRSAICVSTGTAAGAWSVASSTAASPAYTTIHCQ